MEIKVLPDREWAYVIVNIEKDTMIGRPSQLRSEARLFTDRDVAEALVNELHSRPAFEEGMYEVQKIKLNEVPNNDFEVYDSDEIDDIRRKL